MDLGVIPSKEESFGVSAIEALACGIHLVVSNVGGLAEIVKPEHIAETFEVANVEELADIIVRAYNQHRKEYNNGRKFVE